MPQTDSCLPWHDLRKLNRSLDRASDEQIAKVVAAVDALGARGIADEMIAPLRPRLARLRPRRPLRFCRLMFMPLDPLIVSGANWRADSPTIPRPALLPLAEAARVGMATEAATVDALIRHLAADEGESVRSVGFRLWPAAARALAEATQAPAGWTTTTLSVDTFAILARRVASLLEATETLHALFAAADIGVSLGPEVVLPLMQSALAQPADTLAMLLALVLARLPEAREPLILAARMIGQQHEAPTEIAIERALLVLMDRMESHGGIEALILGSSLSQVGAEVRRIGQLLGVLRNRIEPLSRLTDIEARVDTSCRLRFATALEMEFVAALRDATALPDRVALSRLEGAARGLLDLEQQARQFGSRDAYDALLRQATEMVKATGGEQTLRLIDQVRLVEILMGPEEALALLETA